MTIGILVVAHGSPVPAANEELLALLPDVAERGSFDIVEAAYLEGARPSIPEGLDACVQRGASVIVVVPCFLLLGKHVAHDLPALIDEAHNRHPHVEIVQAQHLTDHPLLGAIVLERMKSAGFFGKMDVTE